MRRCLLCHPSHRPCTPADCARVPGADLYATVWGRGDQTTRGNGDQGYANQSHWHNELLHPWGPDSLQFSTGTRREPVENTTHCICPPGSSDCLPFAAPGVPYELHHETWALERAARLYGLKKRAVARVENYTACFPTGMDGQVYAKQLRGCRGRYPRLYVLPLPLPLPLTRARARART